MYKSYSDEDLVLLLKEGKDKAFDELYIRYRDLLVNFVNRRVQSIPIAEEIIQEVFTSIWERRKVLVIQKKFSAYIYTSVRYVVLDYYRAKIATNDYLQEVVDTFEANNSTEEYIYYEELQDALEQSTHLLPKKAKEVFILSRFKNYTNKEIAEELHISTETVKYHITYALKFMRSNLKEFYFLILLFLSGS